jgi:hypothetical protein
MKTEEGLNLSVVNLINFPPKLVTFKYQRLLLGTGLLAIFVFILYLVQFSTPNLVGTDGYYHIKFAYLMRTEGLRPDFPWLPLTILNPEDFSDHHFLFHVLLIPFTFGDLISGAKLASVIFASLTFLSIWWLLRNQNIPFSGLWALGLLAISEAFLYRMHMPRAQSLSLAILAFGLNFLLLRKYKYLLPLSFVYVWLYDAFPLIVVLTIIFIASVWLIEKKLELKPLYFVLIGVLLGLVINPYFPHNIIFLVRHLLPKVSELSAVRVGNEWYPYETSQLLENSPLALITFFSGVFALGFRNQRMDTRTATTLFMTMFFGIMLFQSRRFIEYFPPFVLIFAAFAWTPLISNRINKPDVPTGKTERRARFISISGSKFSTNILLASGIVLLLLALGIWYTTQDTQASLENTKPAERYSQASSWLVENTSNRARIFQTDWDDFPRLFFYNSWNTYLIGLDPTYLQMKDPDLFELWVEITRGREKKPSIPIYERFTAEYVLTDLAHEGFIRQASEDPGMKELYRDGEAVIYRVHPAGD